MHFFYAQAKLATTFSEKMLLFLQGGEKMKKIISLLILTVAMNVISVEASTGLSSVFYRNENGVTFTKEEYDFFSTMYFDGFQSSMTYEDLEYFNGIELNKQNIESVILNEGFKTRATEITSPAKSLKISKVDTTNPVISIVLTWLQNPLVRSYDLIGANLDNVQLFGNVATKLVYSNGNMTPNDLKKSNNGFGVSVQLPPAGSNIKITQTFKTTKGGKVYGSYQHAVTNVSLYESQNYSVSYNGYGHVFQFNNGVNNKYDAMSGVEMNV